MFNVFLQEFKFRHKRIFIFFLCLFLFATLNLNAKLEKIVIDGLKDEQYFFLSDAFLKEANQTFKDAREAYNKQKNHEAVFYLEKLVSNESSDKNLLAKTYLFLAYLYYDALYYFPSKRYFELFLSLSHYTPALLRLAELYYFDSEFERAKEIFHQVNPAVLSFSYDKIIYNFLNSKLYINFYNLAENFKIENASIFDMKLIGDDLIISSITGELLLLNMPTRNERILFKNEAERELKIFKINASERENFYLKTREKIYILDKKGNSLAVIETNPVKGYSKTLNVTSLLLLDNKRLLAGTKEDGLWLYSFLSKDWSKVAFPNFEIKTLLSQNNSYLVVTKEDGIYELDLNLVNLKSLNFFIKSEAERKITFAKRTLENSLWVGTYGGGLFKLNLELMTYEQFTNTSELSSLYVLSVLRDENTLYFATLDNGVKVYNEESKTWTILKEMQELLDISILFIEKWRDTIIMGTLERGLIFLDVKIKNYI